MRLYSGTTTGLVEDTTKSRIATQDEEERGSYRQREMGSNVEGGSV